MTIKMAGMDTPSPEVEQWRRQTGSDGVADRDDVKGARTRLLSMRIC